ncbi:MAG: hypothetical protein K2X43_12700 [Hyphomonadaceae bacterium]|nr:hypothetical protein [Hyphomonadaceae bacterium]
MRKKTRALSGASQDAYFRRVLRAHPALPAEARDRLLRTLRQEVAQLRVRVAPGRDADAPPAAVCGLPPAIAAPPVPVPQPDPPAAPPFDPFSPNIVVVVRKAGREAALAALGAIHSLDNLRLLAREQRLTVGADLSSAAELRIAIVAAAERRIANRMAAAG